MSDDLSFYTVEIRAKTVRRAKRNLRSETKLILSAGFGLILVVTFWFAGQTFLPIAVATGVRPLVVWLLLGFGIALICAVANILVSRPLIAKARAIEAAYQRAHEYEQRAAVARKIATMKSSEDQ